MRIHQERKTHSALRSVLLGLGMGMGLVLGLGACSPLAQAPLVYSSKQSLGLDVSTTSTETPGLAINLGFKGVDAAYVPVAVAQQCDVNKDAASCDQSKFKLTPLIARTTFADTKSPLAQQITQASLDLKSAKELLAMREGELDSKLRARDADTKKAADLVTAQAELAKAQNLATPPSAGADAAATAAYDTAKANLPAIQERVDVAQAASKNAATNIQAVQAATVARGNAQTAVNDALSALDKANAEQSKSLSTTREDAFSVYGSFGGGTNFAGGDKSAGLSVGKVFSTGVASQQLTEGIRAIGCMEAATKATTAISASALPDAEKQRLIISNYATCQSPTSSN